MDIKDEKDQEEDPGEEKGHRPDVDSAGDAPEDEKEKGTAPKKAAASEEHDGHDQHEKADHEDAKSLKGKLRKKEHEIKNHKAEIEELRKEKAEIKDKFLRALAEMDNQRKRLEREKSEFYQFALGDLLKEILMVLDNFERALKNRDQTDDKSFQEGVELIYKQFQDMIRKQGLTPVGAEHQKFDPSAHHAVLTEESDQIDEPEIGEVFQKGYFLNDRLLRPALVKVMVPKKS